MYIQYTYLAYISEKFLLLNVGLTQQEVSIVNAFNQSALLFKTLWREETNNLTLPLTKCRSNFTGSGLTDKIPANRKIKKKLFENLRKRFIIQTNQSFPRLLAYKAWQKQSSKLSLLVSNKTDILLLCVWTVDGQRWVGNETLFSLYVTEMFNNDYPGKPKTLLILKLIPFL